MAHKSPYRTNTTESKLSLPFNGSIYTTRRRVNPRKGTPEIGGTMEAELGSAFQTSRIIGSDIVSDRSQEVQQIIHAKIPTVEAQLLTNWEWTSTDLGGRRFKGITRTFIYLASEFDKEAPVQGAAMEIGSDELFKDDGYVLIDRAVVRSGMQLEPVFRVERRTYLKRCEIKNIGIDGLNGATLTSSQLLYHKDDVIVEEVAGTPTVTITGTTSLDINGSYPLEEATVFLPERYETTVGGKTIYIYFDGAFSKWSIVNSTDAIVLWTSEATTIETTPTPAEVSTWTDANPTQTGSPTCTYAVVGGSAAVTITNLFEDKNNTYWGLQDDGTQRTGQQLSCDWYAVDVTDVIGGTFTDGVVSVHSYSTNENYYWPPVLESLIYKRWARRDGGEDIQPTLKMNPEGYNGPCKTDITITWSKDKFTIPVVEQFLPTRIYYSCPFYVLNIPECLHIALTEANGLAPKCDIGNNDPIYEQATDSVEEFSATSHTSWPASLIAYDDQQPFRGGYLRTRREIFKPAPPV